jgi:hypothetical protein
MKIPSDPVRWKFKFYYNIQNIATVSPIPSQINPVHFILHFLNINFNNIFSSMPRSTKHPLSLRFPTSNTLYLSPLHMYVTCPVYYILLKLIAHIIQGYYERNRHIQLNTTLKVFISFIATLYMERSSDHKAPRYVVFSTTVRLVVSDTKKICY